MIIRTATDRDAASIAAAEWSTAATPGRLVQRPGEIPVVAFATKIAELRTLGSYWVAEDEGAAVGHCFLEPMKMAGNSHVFTLNIVVHPGETGRGIGAALMVHLLQWARTRTELRKIELLVRSANERAISLYKRFGFMEEGRLRDRVLTSEGTFIDDIAMAWFSDSVGPVAR
jgi:ribosomal protein S18 acetylase RimI-like enzyme